MGHLLSITSWDRTELESFFPLAQNAVQALASPTPPVSRLAGRWLANLFFEDSTRTRLSFETAAGSLGMRVSNWTASGSSVSKGETLPDTIRNVDAMGPAAIVLRHPMSGAPQIAARHSRAAIINAGDGTHEHPSQALLDAFTLWKRWGSFEGRTVAIVGDVLHSRVARSNLHVLRTLGAKVVMVAPPSLMPAGIEALGAQLSHSLDEVLPGLDAVMMLRLQVERQKDAFFPSVSDYGRRFALTEARADALPAEAVVLHPGPMNRGVEIASAVADGPRSLVLSQVAYGVAVRRALLEKLL